MKRSNLASFLDGVAARVEEAISDPSFHEDQRRLLAATVAPVRAGSVANPFGDPLCLTYLIARAFGRDIDAQAEHVGAACLLYLLSLDLFDDVQDDDLAGKPHAEAGPAIAINSAITLCFLAQDQLRRALELEPSAEARMDYLRLYGRVSLAAVAGQHRDLMGAEGARTPGEVLAMQQAKTSSLSLLTECGALLGRVGSDDRRRMRTFGEKMALFVQVRDDLRDIFGKELSPDLATGKMTYPIACFLEDATDADREKLRALVGALPGSMRAIRTLMYESGATMRSAEALESFRSEMHALVAETGRDAAELRTLLDVVDGLAESVYVAPPIEATRHLHRPNGRWHRRVRDEAALFHRRMADHGCPRPPELRPWHQAHWMYVPQKRVIFYPDIEGLAGEVLPFQAALLGTDDLGEVARVMEGQVPAVVAHEMFHFSRDQAGRLSSDHWHEEWAANRLAVAYTARYCPDALASALDLAQSVIARFPERLDERADGVLARCCRFDPGASGYEMDMLSMAVASLELIRRLALEAPDLDRAVAELLGDPSERVSA